MAAPTTEFTTTTNGALDLKWQHLEQQHSATALIFNRSEDGDMKAKARARLDDLDAEKAELENQMKDAARIITVTRLAPKAYARLVAQHPPREGDPFDAETGFNTDTFDHALMDAAITNVVDGHGKPVEDFTWADVVDEISFGQFQVIIQSTLAMNSSTNALPFSLAG